MVRTNTVVAPGSDAAVVRVRGTRKAVAMTTDCNSRYIYLDPERAVKLLLQKQHVILFVQVLSHLRLRTA